jgi:hypothetical protein
MESNWVTPHVGHQLAYCTRPGLLMRMENLVEWQGKSKYSEKNLFQWHVDPPPTWPDMGWNPGRRGGKLATNRLSYGMALPT